MSVPALFSDLDVTLIYSLSQLHKRGQSSAGRFVAEEYQDVPLSFVKLETWQQLATNAGNLFDFVPTTTRTFDQYKRIFFPAVDIKAAVVLNGAQIIIDGKEDMDWSREVAAGVAAHNYLPLEVLNLLNEKLEGCDEVKTLRDADQLFNYVVAQSSDSPYVDAVTKEIAELTGFVRSKQGRKTYLVPATVSKGRAVRELIARWGSTITFGAGDSLLDFTMIPEVDYFLNPVHGDVPPAEKNVFRTTREGIDASEEMLDFVVSTIKK